MQDQFYDMLVKEDEITWQTILQDLIKSEQMNPWDIDISVLSKRYMETIKGMKEHNFFISGKVVLASAVLLRIKSSKLLLEDIANLDDLMYNNKEYEELDEYDETKEVKVGNVTILPRVPQPRKRKVSMEELMVALNKALEVKKRRVLRRMKEDDAPEVFIPVETMDISVRIKMIYKQVKNFFLDSVDKRLTFDKLTPSDSREDRINTFVPLLHLCNHEKLDLLQEEHFGEIEIKLTE